MFGTRLHEVIEGIHPPYAETYVRSMRVPKDDPFLELLLDNLTGLLVVEEDEHLVLTFATDTAGEPVFDPPLDLPLPLDTPGS